MATLLLRTYTTSRGTISRSFGAWVSVLPSSARAAKPLNPEITLRSFQVRRSKIGLCVLHYRDGHSRRVHAAAPLGRRHSLYSMAPSLVPEALDTSSLNRQGNGVEPASRGRNIQPVTLSRIRGSQTLVGLRQISYKKLGVIAAFCGTNF
jgi:hypothetical protein